MANLEPRKVVPNKQLFRLLNVEFVEEVREFQCDRCDNKLFDHYIANCGHKFCHNCQRLVGDGSGRWRCPQCNEFIKTVDGQDVEFEERFYEQEVHCSNKNYGCQHKDKLKNILDHVKTCDKTKEAALPVEIVTTAEIKNIWEEIFQMKRRIEENANDRDIDGTIAELNNRNYVCSAGIHDNNNYEEIDNKFENFKVEMMKSMDDLNKKVEALDAHLETLKGAEEKDFNKAKNKIEKIKTEVDTQKHIMKLEADNNNLKYVQLTQSLDQLNKTAMNLLESNIPTIKMELDKNKLQIQEAKERIENAVKKQQVDTARLDDGEVQARQLKDSIESIEVGLKRAEVLQSEFSTNVRRMKLKLEQLEGNQLPRVSIMEHRTMTTTKERTIVLIGESGSGKPSLINAFANYARFKSLDEAIASQKAITLIPSAFSIKDNKGVDYSIKAGVTIREGGTETRVQSTFKCNSYRFKFRNSTVRLMDIPSVGDCGEEAIDREHAINVLKLIRSCSDVRAIGIVMKSTEEKLTDKYRDFLRSLLRQLNELGANDIVFILTFSRGNYFVPFPTKELINSLFESDMRFVLDRNRVFRFDNECYEYLIAADQGVKFNGRAYEVQRSSWERSSAEMKRLMSRVGQLTPRKVSLEEAGNTAE